MRFLVTAEGIDFAVPVVPADAAGFLDTVVVPSEEMFAKLEADGKVHGGVFAGRRGGAAIVDVDSHDELNALLTSLPLWGFAKWEVVPLQAFDARAAQDAAMVEVLRSMA